MAASTRSTAQIAPKEIAVHMVVSPFTAKTHISRAMTKPGARDRAQPVVFAYESGPVEARGAPGTARPAGQE